MDLFNAVTVGRILLLTNVSWLKVKRIKRLQLFNKLSDLNYCLLNYFN